MASTGSRKRVKPNPPGTDARSSLPSYNDSSVEPARGRSTLRKQGSRASWWPRGPKAAAVTEVARESISVSGSVTSDRMASNRPLSTHSKHSRSPSFQLMKEGLSRRSLPADATTTRIHITSDGSASALDTSSALATASTARTQDRRDGGVQRAKEREESKEDNRPNRTGDTAQPPKEAQDPATDGKSASADIAGDGPNKEQAPSYWSSVNQHQRRLLPASRLIMTRQYLNKRSSMLIGQAQKQKQKQKQKQGLGQEQNQSKRLSKKQRRAQRRGGPGSPCGEIAADQPAAEEVDAKPSTEETENGCAEGADSSKRPPLTPKSSSGWLFWSRSTPPKDTSQDKTQESQNGEPAVSETPPPKQPKEAPESEIDIQKVPAKAKAKGKTVKDSGEIAAATAIIQEQERPTPPSPPKAKAPEVSASKQLQKVLPNQVLPSFKDTFALQERPSLMQTIGRLFHYTKESERKHVYALRDPPRIKKALAIGVHGYFPAPLIRSVLGQPTGTSVKFSNMAAKAIRKWAEDHGFTCEVEKISLEGEGRIAERLDLLWKLLLNWIEEIRKADFILVACHSQGVPVATMLVAKLISFGCLNATHHVGICAMAGVNMGPFAEYKSRWISGSAGELFEFANPNSKVSQDYEAALESVLNFGVRVAYIGSIDDQLVSLESSLFAPATHPYICRAVFVDGRVHAPNFISHLVGFTLKLRNLGISDHGLIRELSSPLAGSLYTGEGHSRLYDDEAVYYLAIQFALETSNVSGATLRIQRTNPCSTPNPYILPFAMRGILEEDYVRRELYQETMELLRQFDDWKPSSKVLKDVKFRLEGVRSKL
ncbi:hypothetical protein M432DRAFT_636475 [Thermoascus aurantiacus ATCC 26904]